MIHILVADDDEIMRRGISDVLASGEDMHLVAEAWDGASAIDAARRLSPDVALLDIRMPGMDGLAAAREIHSLPAPVQVIMLTMFGEDDYIDMAVRAGASGFLLKDTPPEDLLRAVRHVAAGRAMLDPTVTGRVMHQLSRYGVRLTDTEQAALAHLNPREIAVLRLIARGLSNADIGAMLHVSEGTVKGQVSRLLAKIGAENRVQAARLAYRAGLER